MIHTVRTSRRHYAMQRRVVFLIGFSTVALIAEFAVILSRML